MKTIVFPITSSCDQRCIFCSHRGNPDTIKLGVLSLDNDQIFNNAKKIKNSEIIIGESATKINEGEPFLFKNIKLLLRILDENNNKICLTTSGSKLDENMISFLSTLKKVELNLSLNSSNIDIRKKIMGENGAEIACNSPKLLKKYRIKYNGSIVALNLGDNFEYVKNTIKYLYENEAQFIRVFIPGYTDKYGIDETDYNSEKLKKALYPIRFEIPVLIEPDFINNEVNIKGIFKNSPAYKAGLLFNDIILSVNKNKVFSQTQTYIDIKNSKDPIICVKREHKKIEVVLKKEAGDFSGILFSEDISYQRFDEIKNIVFSGDNKLICSEFSYSFFKDKFGENKVINVPNKTFGGNIKCNGLLTVSDILDVLLEEECQSIVINGNFLDNEDKDITGRSIYDITSEKRINIIFV